MNNILKSWKTTSVAIAQLVLCISVLVMFYLGKIDITGLQIGIPLVIGIGSIVGNLFAKDGDKSHSIGMTVDPDRETPDERG
jgi:hypothetical protein